MSMRRKNAVAWFAVSGGAVAFTAQFVFGMQLSLARCEVPATRFHPPVQAWAIGLAAGAAVVVVLAQLASIAIFRATRDEKGRAERIHFLAVVGMTVNPLLLVLVLMHGVGVPVLTICQQS
jgi:hypothetical protein